jgi:Na+-driven multidrug efflux pump
MLKLANQPLVVAVVVGLLVIIFLALLQPPFVYQKTDHPLLVPTVSYVTIFVLGGVAAAATFLLPIGVDAYKRHTSPGTAAGSTAANPSAGGAATA